MSFGSEAASRPQRESATKLLGKYRITVRDTGMLVYVPPQSVSELTLCLRQARRAAHNRTSCRHQAGCQQRGRNGRAGHRQLTAAVHTRPRADVARDRELCRIAPRYDDIWLGSQAR
jgi:hypothetical protein